MSAQGPYRAFARAATSPRPASTMRRVLACLGGLRDRLDGRKRRLTMLGLAKRQPGAFAVLMHGDPGDCPNCPHPVMTPALSALEARRTLRCLNANERVHVAHQVAECWTCEKLLADEDPCGFPHGRLEDLATKRIAGLIKEQR